ncbi:hypothetical protein MRX96_030587 [Rhipicephalus microplus]
MGRRRRKRDDLSPQPVYWDPRYKRYFYAGVLPPLDAAVFPRVELEPIKPTRRPSILVTNQASEREERRERHISWGPPDDDDDDEGGAAEDDQRVAAPAWRPAASATSLVVALALLSLLAVAFALWATDTLEYAGRGALTARQDVSATEATVGTTVQYREVFETGATAGKLASVGRRRPPVTTLTDEAETKINTKAGATPCDGQRRSRKASSTKPSRPDGITSDTRPRNKKG